MELSSVPIEVPWRSGAVLRGIEVRKEPTGPGLIFVHDLGRDLDEFGSLPLVLAQHGFRVVSIDLPGHGLSDGEGSDMQECREAFLDLVGLMASEAGQVGVVASGAMATVGAELGREAGVPAQVLVNPRLDPSLADGRCRAQTVRIVFHGEGRNMAGTATQRFFSHLVGEKFLVSNRVVADGAAQLAVLPSLRTHVVLFFKRYLNAGERGRP